MKDFLISVFPNYTKAMYEGNEPCGLGHQRESGGYNDRWETKYGGGETYGNIIDYAEFHFDANMSLSIVGGECHLLVILANSKFKEYASSPAMRHLCSSEKQRIQLSEEEIERLLNKQIPNCRFWDIVQQNAKEIYERRSEGGD